jgi:predicted nucleic acid-binding protein
VTLVYLDSSAVIKLFLQEPFTGEVEAAVQAPDAHCLTSDLTYAEVHGFFSRALKLGRITPGQQRSLLKHFQDWFARVSHAGLPFERVQRAGHLAVRQNLRGADALHLITALERVGAYTGERRVFACFDERLTYEAFQTGLFDEFVTDPAWL